MDKIQGLDIWTFLYAILIGCAAIVVLWSLFLWLHTKNSERHYTRISIPVTKGGIIKNDTKLNWLLKLFFYRQITYEFSAYAILLICVFFLIACIGLFLNANHFVVLDDPLHKMDVQEKLISLISIRAGVALVIFFICRVLLKLYKYCLQFSAFYTGLFDAFLLQETAELKIEAAIQTFAIKTSLDGEDKSPTDEAMEVLKKAKEIIK